MYIINMKQYRNHTLRPKTKIHTMETSIRGLDSVIVDTRSHLLFLFHRYAESHENIQRHLRIPTNIIQKLVFFIEMIRIGILYN